MVFNPDTWGTVADWVGGLGTTPAFLATAYGITCDVKVRRESQARKVAYYCQEVGRAADEVQGRYMKWAPRILRQWRHWDGWWVARMRGICRFGRPPGVEPATIPGATAPGGQFSNWPPRRCQSVKGLDQTEFINAA
jgi:hypothetical protein